MAGSLGRAVGTIDFQFNGDDAVERARRGLRGIREEGTSTKESLNQVGNVAGVAGAAVVGGLGLAVKSAADFEKGLSAIKAVSGSTASEMDTVRQKALDIGADTAFSASEASGAIEELVKAGLSIPDVMNGAADATVALAAAGEIALPEAATIASNAMNQFALDAKDLPHVADLIAGAANASAIDVSQFGYSLSQAGAVAKVAGLDLDETTNAIAQLGNAGIVGSDAGTSLKTMLTNLQPSSKKAYNQMKALGIITDEAGNRFYDAEGNLKSLSEIQGILQESTAGLSEETKTSALQTIFGSDAIRAAAVLADNGAQGYNDMAAAIGKVGAAEVATTRLDNLNGSIEALKGSLETAAISLGTIMIPIIRQIVDQLNVLVDKFSALSPETQKTIVVVAAAVGGFLLLGAAIIKTALFIQQGIAAFTAIKTAVLGFAVVQKIIPIIKALSLAVKGFTLSLLTNPVFLIIAAVVLLGVALWAFFTKTETGRKLWDQIWNGIKAAVDATIGWITGAAVPALIAAWQWIVDGAKSVWDGVVDVFNAIGSFLQAIANAYVAYVMFWVNGVLAVIDFFVGAATAVWQGFWYLFGDLIKAAWELIVAIVNFYINTMVAVITTVVTTLQSWWTTAWNAVSSAFMAVWNAIVAFITPIINWIVSAITAAVDQVRSWWQTAWGAIVDFFMYIWNALVAFYGPIIARIIAFILQLVAKAKTEFQKFVAIKDLVVAIFQVMVDVIGQRVSAIVDKVKGMISTVRALFNGAKNWLLDAGKNIIQGLIDGIQNMVGKLTDKLKFITKLIPERKGPPRKDAKMLTDNGELIMKGLIRGVQNQVPALSSVLSGIGSNMPITLTGAAVASNASGQRMASAGTSTGSVPTAPASAGSLIGVQNVYNPIAEPAAQTAQAEARKRSMAPTL